jgi:glucosamine 6-phosphate synthetase-like amidotransferase/phosphosugar isomerase protein
MCGIVVGLSFGKLNQRDELMRQRLLRYFTTELMLATEDRGKDATGAAVLFDDGKYIGLKKGEKVSEFLSTFGESKDCYGSLLKIWREHPCRSRIYLGHCRAGTVGDSKYNKNNHPIKIGNLVGIHNGQIKNHKIIFDHLKCERDGEVDSEAIFRLFEYYTKKGKEPFTMDMIQKVADRLEGTFAVTLFNADNLEQVPIFRDGRPVEFTLIRKYGILLIASETKFWNRVYFRYERMANYYNEMYNNTLPSFLEKGDIQTGYMQDDTAIIFDLSKEVNEHTTIDDLGESRRIVRTNKIWKSPVKTYHSGYAGYSGYNNRHNNYQKHKDKDEKKDKEVDTRKRRVFDKITKQYKIKIGDKELDNKKAATLYVHDTDKSGGKNTTIDNIGKKKDNKDNTFRQDNEKEDTSLAIVKVDDITTYDNHKNKIENEIGENINNTKDADVIDIYPKDDETVDYNVPKVVEVRMITNPPEIVEAANKAYEDIPYNEKGCADIEELLDILEIKDKKTAESVGMAFVGNRAIKHGWLQGYIHAMNSLDVSNKTTTLKKMSILHEKGKRRESHIAGLKSLVLLLAEFHNKSKDKGLSQIVLSSHRKVDIKKLINVFNNHEKESLSVISDVISQAEALSRIYSFPEE